MPKSQNLPINTILLSIISVFILAILIVLISQNIAQTSKTTQDLTIKAPACTGTCMLKSACEQQRRIEINKNCAQAIIQSHIPQQLGGFTFLTRIIKPRQEEVVCCI